MFERPTAGDRALLVELDFGDGEPAERVVELKALARSAGAEIADVVTARRTRPDPALFAGRGKVAEIAARRAETGADLSSSIMPSRSAAAQTSKLASMPCRRSRQPDPRLFAQRAQSSEGKLQVELAQLKHLSSGSCGAGRTSSGRKAASGARAR